MKRLIFKCLLILLTAIILVTCATVSNVTVNKAGNRQDLRQGSFIYAMPQTVLDVKVVAEEITVVPGPFERYARKYLGIENVPSKTEKIYNLKSISISHHLEADPDYIYTVNGVPDPSVWPGIQNLLRDSLILSAADFSGNQTSNYIWSSPTSDLLFTDLSVKRNFEAEKDVEISMVLPDTGYVTPRVSSKTVLKEKTLEQKAEEAANFLIKLKKRRFKLVAGQYDYMPEGESMSAALDELSRIENEYLALFAGRRITTEIRKDFHFTPETGKDNSRIVLFRFSATNGFTNANDSEGIPVIVELQAMNKTRELGNIPLPVKQQVNLLPYRIPDQVAVRVMAGEQVWADAIYPVFQFGSPVALTIVK